LPETAPKARETTVNFVTDDDDGLVAVPTLTCNHYDEVAALVERLDQLIEACRQLGIDLSGFPLPSDVAHLRIAVVFLSRKLWLVRLCWAQDSDPASPDPGDDRALAGRPWTA
jgi:hypothetical protein